jgi:hypothetical protein
MKPLLFTPSAFPSSCYTVPSSHSAYINVDSNKHFGLTGIVWSEPEDYKVVGREKKASIIPATHVTLVQ